jgi:hypothetical protein
VRCGSCGTVFDAGAQMQHTEARAPTGADPTDAGSGPSAWSLLLDEEERQDESLRRKAADDPEPELETKEYEESIVIKTDDLGQYSDPEIDPVVATTVVLTDASFAPPEPEPAPEQAKADEMPAAAAPAPLDWPAVPASGSSAAEVDFLISQLDGDSSPAEDDFSPGQAEREAHARDIASHIIRRRRASPAREAGNEMPALVRASADLSQGPMPPVETAPPARPVRAAGPAPQAGPRAKPGPSKPRRPITPAAPPQDDVPSFMREAQRRRYWRQPWVRICVVLAALVVLALLGLRWVHDKRDWLAAAYPDTRPGLNALCGVLGCEIQPLRMLDGVAIEGSSFNRLASGDFRLNLSLRNTERLELATPSLELSLTDAQDQVVFTRVIHPRDMQAPAVLLPRRDWSGGLTLALEPPLSSQVAGYRVLAFYP